MPKSLTIDPAEQRRRSAIRAPEIPVNAYVSDPAAEAACYSREQLVGIYHDMLLIREFETALDGFKKQGHYRGIQHNHAGPAHLSIGQEAAAVGQCVQLDPQDFILGSHRSHGEILAKGLSAIRALEEQRLLDVMKGFHNGAALRLVESLKDFADIRALAKVWLIYTTCAEIFAREYGFNKGMGGSMHAFFPPFGIMPNNAIVGGSADIALGMALFKRINRKSGIVIANIGDSSVASGPVWEAMNFAAMDQYRTLWDANLGGAPPILFNFINNFYGMGGQPQGETLGQGMLARVGLGVNADAMHSERVDGYDPLAVADATRRAKALLLAGRGPAMLDVITYRYSGHSPSDASSYRGRDEINLWRRQDSIRSYRAYLRANGHAPEAELEEIQSSIVEMTRLAIAAAVDLDLSPRLDPAKDAIGSLMFSGDSVDAMESTASREAEVLQSMSDSRLKVTAGKHRYAFDEGGERHPKLKTLTYAEAIFEAMIHRFYSDPTMIAFGEENRDWGGAFGAYRGLTEAIPYHRLFNTPISEAAIVGAGVGYALAGGRAVPELMYCDFMGRAGDEIFNQMAKWQAMSGELLRMPLVLRASVGMKYGAQHSQDWSSIVAHIPGLKVYFPATPYDAKGMLNRALRGSDPVVFFESQRLYNQPETLFEGGVPIEYYEVDEGEPYVHRTGSDVTIITIGAALYRALEAADVLAREHDISAEVIDARFLNPLNYAPIIESVKKTGRVLLASDASERGSFLHTMASNISQLAFDYLDGPVAVLGARNWITPPAELDESFFPGVDWMIDIIHQRLLPLPGYQPRSAQGSQEIIKRNRAGV
ncbi:MAG: thiamine pyrophosphate-dependent enzyme [Chloroflexota bacterium]|nr:thiamine pyrophosphate-dependent enzyme [Chloroflexota bacterium]MDE2948959.1 thiamine pyrophosphate-dependent enzyme [Chloroflexota bacterium]